MELVARLRVVGAVGVVERRPAGGRADGPPIVVVPGYGVSVAQVRPTVEALAPHGRVAVLELPGFGRPGASRGLPLQELAGALEGWLDEAGETSATFVASSVGCQPVVELAARCPERVDGLVLVGPTPDPAARSLLRHAARLLATAPFEPPRLLALVARDYLRTGPRAALRTAREALAHEVERTLPLVRAAAVVVRGERDAVVPQRWAEEAARLLPRGRLVVVPGASHAAVFSHPRAVAREAASLLRG